MKETLLEKIDRISLVMTNYSSDLIIGLVMLISGVLAVKYLVRGIRLALERSGLSPQKSEMTCNILMIVLYIFLFVATAGVLGFNSRNLFRFLVIATLLIVVMVMLFKPYLPSLPFKPGQTIKTGSLLGKVEATTFLNTRMRTFDGKTVWIPNSKILNDYLINYHITPSRRIHLDLRIRYDQDLMKAKRVLEEVMILDPRVLTKPRPVVYLTHLREDCIILGGRCWVNNLKYWTTRCDLLEKIKLRFDQEKIAFALPQRYVYMHSEGPYFPEPDAQYLERPDDADETE